jgi:hypothetical protein
MVQRIQSLYLFISLILYLILLFGPLFYVHSNADEYTIYSYKINPGQNTLQMNVMPLFILISIIAGILLFSIFLYKHRKLQVRIVQVNLVLGLVSLVLIGIYLYSFSTLSADAHIRLTLSISIPFISSVLQYLAIRGIKKDQSLVDSLNRLR